MNKYHQYDVEQCFLGFGNQNFTKTIICPSKDFNELSAFVSGILSGLWKNSLNIDHYFVTFKCLPFQGLAELDCIFSLKAFLFVDFLYPAG